MSQVHRKYGLEFMLAAPDRPNPVVDADKSIWILSHYLMM